MYSQYYHMKMKLV